MDEHFRNMTSAMIVDRVEDDRQVNRSQRNVEIAMDQNANATAHDRIMMAFGHILNALEGKMKTNITPTNPSDGSSKRRGGITNSKEK